MQTGRTITPVLSVDMDFDRYAREHAGGRTPDRFPYGLESLPPGWQLRYAGPRLGGRLTTWLRRAVRKVTGADVVAALQRCRAIRDADVLYAHNEADYLGAAFVLRLFRARRPYLVGQTIWLFAEWESQPRWRRALHRWLMARVDLFVYNAAPNLDLGACIVPRGAHEYIPFGVSPVFGAHAPWTGDEPLVLSVGNDRSRDWETLASAVAGLPEDLRVRLATSQRPEHLDRAEVRPTESVDELCELYRTARCLVVALGANAHAGGITTILEAAAIGTPVVATLTGGLERYFDDVEVAWVPEGDPEALRDRILELVEDHETAAALGLRGHARVVSSGYTNVDYWVRVVACVEAHPRVGDAGAAVAPGPPAPVGS